MTRYARSNVLLLALIAPLACGKKKEEGEKSSVTTSLKSTGIKSLGLRHHNLTTVTSSTFQANSSVTVESFELPIGRINLTAGDTGTGYTEASPNLYGCPGTTNEECMVDLVKTDLNDLLKSNTGAQEITIDSEKTYTGTAIEICADGKGGPGTTFKAKLKASGSLAGVTYYTNATSGVSTIGPAESVELTMSCGGLNTDLIAPVTIKPGDTISAVFWADPTGSVVLSNNGAMINIEATSNGSSPCTSTATDVVSFCAGKPSVFGTTVAGTTTVSRYLLSPTAFDDGSTNTYADALVTVLTDANGASFGANLKQVYTDVPGASKLLHASKMDFASITESAGKLSLNYYGSGSTPTAVITDLPKDGNGTSVRLLQLTEKVATMSSTKL